jgi:putative hydroxymethylpyrimidine transport system substrate-binding protein
LPRLLTPLLLVFALLLGGCGSTGSPGSPGSTSSTSSTSSASPAGSRPRTERNATLVLDFTPNAVHAGIYTALARGYDRAQGVDLHVVAPSASTGSIKLLETGRANFAILDLHDLAIARERGEAIKAIMAIVERPLAAVIAAPQIHNPRQLQSRTVGVTGVPSDTAVLRSIVAGSGGDPAAVKQVVIGYDAVPDLIAGRVAAVTSFWNDEGVTLQRRDAGVHIFRVDEFGAPSYPELVLCATSSSLRTDPGLARAVVRALVAGYRLALADPAVAAASLESRVAGLDPKLVTAELAALRPAFAAPDGRVGELDLARLRSWASWEAKFGIVRRVPDVASMFAPGFVPDSAGGG